MRRVYSYYLKKVIYCPFVQFIILKKMKIWKLNFKLFSVSLHFAGFAPTTVNIQYIN